MAKEHNSHSLVYCSLIFSCIAFNILYDLRRIIKYETFKFTNLLNQIGFIKNRS